MSTKPTWGEPPSAAHLRLGHADLRWLQALVTALSIASFLLFFHRDQILLPGDATAHMSIARRVFDSRTPGLLQLGTVWLPLPHLLMIPFLWPDYFWRTGIGGSIPSMLSYVLACWAIFRLLHLLLGNGEPGVPARRIGSWFGTLLFALNPNLLYVQSVAFTEPVYLAPFLWAVVFLAQFSQAIDDCNPRLARRNLFLSGLCLAAAMFCRYDAWVLGLFLAAFAIARTYATRTRSNLDEPSSAGAAGDSPAHECRVEGQSSMEPRRGGTKNALPVFLLICSAAPLLWLAYNRAVYGDAFEFARGPNSAQAIEHRIQQPPHPGTQNVRMATLFYLRAVQRNLAEDDAGKFWIALAVLGTLFAFRFRWHAVILLILWLPLPFYAFSIAYSGVPVYVPEWWPFGLYNIRYGLELLPAIAVGAGILIYNLASFTHMPRAIAALSLLLLAATYVPVWRNSPICAREAEANSRTRIQLENEVADVLRTLPSDSVILMSLRDYAGVVQRAGLPIRRIIHSDNHRMWVHPQDPQGAWELGQTSPQQVADYALGFRGDVVDNLARARNLPVFASFEKPGWPRATIYRVR